MGDKSPKSKDKNKKQKDSVKEQSKKSKDAQTAAKAALYIAMREAKIGTMELAGRLHCKVEVGFDRRSLSAGFWTQSLAAPIGGGLQSQQPQPENCKIQLDGGLGSPPRVTVISGFSPSTEMRLEPELAQPTSKMRCSPRPI